MSYPAHLVLHLVLQGVSLPREVLLFGAHDLCVRLHVCVRARARVGCACGLIHVRVRAHLHAGVWIACMRMSIICVFVPGGSLSTRPTAFPDLPGPTWRRRVARFIVSVQIKCVLELRTRVGCVVCAWASALSTIRIQAQEGCRG